MAHVNVTIAGRTYRMACGEGEEAHLEALAQGFDARIGEMRKTFGEIGDMRLHVMAALTLADELAELKERMAAQEAEVAALRVGAASVDAEREAERARVSDRIEAAAQRMERLARRLAGNSAG